MAREVRPLNVPTTNIPLTEPDHPHVDIYPNQHPYSFSSNYAWKPILRGFRQLLFTFNMITEWIRSTTHRKDLTDFVMWYIMHYCTAEASEFAGFDWYEHTVIQPDNKTPESFDPERVRLHMSHFWWKHTQGTHESAQIGWMPSWNTFLNDYLLPNGRCWPKVYGTPSSKSRRASDYANLLAQGWRMFYWFHTCRTDSVPNNVCPPGEESPYSSQPRGCGQIYEFGISSPLGTPSSSCSAGNRIEDRVLQIYSSHNKVEENPRSVAMLMAHHYRVVCHAAVRNPPAPVYPTFHLGVANLHRPSAQTWSHQDQCFRYMQCHIQVEADKHLHTYPITRMDDERWFGCLLYTSPSPRD